MSMTLNDIIFISEEFSKFQWPMDHRPYGSRISTGINLLCWRSSLNSQSLILKSLATSFHFSAEHFKWGTSGTERLVCGGISKRSSIAEWKPTLDSVKATNKMRNLIFWFNENARSGSVQSSLYAIYWV